MKYRNKKTGEVIEAMRFEGTRESVDEIREWAMGHDVAAGPGVGGREMWAGRVPPVAVVKNGCWLCIAPGRIFPLSHKTLRHRYEPVKEKKPVEDDVVHTFEFNTPWPETPPKLQKLAPIQEGVPKMKRAKKLVRSAILLWTLYGAFLLAKLVNPLVVWGMSHLPNVGWVSLPGSRWRSFEMGLFGWIAIAVGSVALYGSLWLLKKAWCALYARVFGKDN